MFLCESLRKNGLPYPFILFRSQNEKSYQQGFSIVEQASAKRGTKMTELIHTVKMIVFYPNKKSFFLNPVNKSRDRETEIRQAARERDFLRFS